MTKSEAPYARERSIAIRAVLRASQLTSSVFDKLISASDSLTKSDKSPVTVGDFGAQAVVNSILATHFPDDPIVGEEDSSDLKTEEGKSIKEQVCRLAREALKGAATNCPGLSGQGVQKQEEEDLTEEKLLAAIDRGNHEGGAIGRMWALDPIDGTKGFLRGGQYAVCLAFIVDGVVQVGVMGCPNLPISPADPKPSGDKERDAQVDKSKLGTVYVAVRGQGAFQRTLHDETETRISMRSLSASKLSQASFCESVESGHSSHGTNARIAELLGIKNKSVRMDSQAKYASIARGDGDIYLRLPVGDGSYQEKIWDHASGLLLVEEAGGKVTDLRGQALNFGAGRTLRDNKGVVAAHWDVHGQVIEAVSKALMEEGRGSLL
ncbi:putative MET22-protein ser/thr phosphatase [Tilletiaria anomala UBC 951]|uniref:3'(2'),5'-bisphosphate nucleotidase n=1 Tax=Tilletiaria anomala (strain ATCC 24038 / CBS 436.72 / UBC 951) TaxID=1037660 RepID=A0A066V4X9_TILAU|nr:putative MET22-protein ser/thr phosphatase [Tilletiaria anomala UBC 951]KDN36782.1 putative MET22-protein ser/thr phosphatase [Tilletiaria anomala UBC 951]